MVGIKSRSYSNSGWLLEGEYSMPFFSTRHSPNYELHIQIFDIQAETMFILIKCLCTSYGYELWVTRCRGDELHVNRRVSDSRRPSVVDRILVV